MCRAFEEVREESEESERRKAIEVAKRLFLGGKLPYEGGNRWCDRPIRWRSQSSRYEAVCLMPWHHFDSNFRCSQKHTMHGAKNTLRQTGKLYLLQPENSFPESSSNNRRIIWKPRKGSRNRNFPGLFWHRDITKRAVTSPVFGLAEWHQIRVIVVRSWGADGLQLRHKLLLLVGVQMGISSHDDGNSIADSLGYQNNRVPKFDTERNVAVSNSRNSIFNFNCTISWFSKINREIVLFYSPC